MKPQRVYTKEVQSGDFEVTLGWSYAVPRPQRAKYEGQYVVTYWHGSGGEVKGAFASLEEAKKYIESQMLPRPKGPQIKF